MATTDLSRDLDKLRSDIDEIRKDIASLARGMRDLGAAKRQEALARAEALGDRARRRALETEERFGREVGERPFTTILTAFGIGFLIAKLLDGDR